MVQVSLKPSGRFNQTLNLLCPSVHEEADAARIQMDEIQIDYKVSWRVYAIIYNDYYNPLRRKTGWLKPYL